MVLDEFESEPLPLDEKLVERVNGFLGTMKAGTYTLIGLDGSGHPAVLPRFLGLDKDGILYYGMSEYVPARIGELRKTICSFYGENGYKGSGHSGGAKLSYSEGRLKELFPSYDCYRVRVRPCREFKEMGEPHWSQRESVLLDNYRKHFGEAPPLDG